MYNFLILIVLVIIQGMVVNYEFGIDVDYDFVSVSFKYLCKRFQYQQYQADK